MKKKVLLLAMMSVMTLMVMADEYIDPQTNVVYTYEPGQNTASVKAGYEEVIDIGHGYELDVVYHPGSPDAAGDVVILDRFTIGTEEYVVTRISENAFRENKNIKSISIPETVTDIGTWAFYACNSLAAVHLPEGLTQIAQSLFSGCSHLVSVNIPSSVSTIDCYAFNGCSSLTSLNLPAGLSFIGRYAFNGTPWYAALYDEAPDGLFYIGSQLFGYKGDKPTGELVIKNGTTCIGFNALSGCDGITSISIPSSIAYIDKDAFYGCTSLTAVHITDLAAWCGIDFEEEFRSSSNPLSKAHHLYLNGEEVIDLVIPEGVTSISDYAFDYCTDLNSVTIPDGVTKIGNNAFRDCKSMTSVTIPPSLATIGNCSFIWCFNLDAVHISDIAAWCGITMSENTANPLYYGAHLFLNGEELKDLVIPEGVTNINSNVFRNFSALKSVTIPSSVRMIESGAFHNCWALSSVISKIEEPFEIVDKVFERYNSETFENSFTPATLYVPKGCKERYESTAGWKRFSKIIEDDYRPMIEEGKVWKLGGKGSANPVQLVEYYYFDGDTIIDGKVCKQMMCQRYYGPDYQDDDCITIPIPDLRYVGAWYEEDKKVYYYAINNQLKMMYDFSLEANDTLLVDNEYQFVVGPKQTGGLKGFKDVYRYIMWYWSESGSSSYSTTWLEGVGSIDGPTNNVFFSSVKRSPLLMSCTIGDEVIYLNDEYEDGATPAEARKRRFDFSHTIKTKPKARRQSGEEQSLYGEYNDQQLGINLDPLIDAYQVRITDESGKLVYEKSVNAGSIVGLNIDISAYAKGRYTVIVENSQESFTGQFETQATGIEELKNSRIEELKSIYNLQGQRLNSLQKGLNIVNGRKVYVK